MPLCEAARNAVAKISAVLPPELRLEAESSALLVGPRRNTSREEDLLFQIRTAIRAERKLEIAYMDLNDQKSTRILWPCAVGFFDQCQVMVAWCELRHDFRHFRIDRILNLSVQDERYPQRRQTLLGKWRKQTGIPAQ